MKSEWEEHRITFPHDPRKVTDGHTLATVYHVAHLRAARRILEDGFLRAGLVNDGSKLDTSRTCVTFMSANTWAYGSIYGNVAWAFDWKRLVQDKCFHWVETKTGGAYPMYRFLVSDRVNVPGLVRYDPEVDRGPLRLRSGDWFWNSHSRVSEFLFDGDISLEDCEELRFENHHPQYCRAGSGCPDRVIKSHRAAAQTLAFILGNDIHSLDTVLSKENTWRNDCPLHDAVERGVNELFVSFSGNSRLSGRIDDPDECILIMRGALALYGSGQVKQARLLASQLKGVDELEKAIVEIVNDHFGVQGWTPNDET